MGRTTSLRSALKATLFPLAAAHGFVIDKSAQPQFTTFRRHSGDEVHVFDVQWDKNGEPRFVINFGKAPAKGVTRQGAPVAAENLEVYDCKPMLRLQRKRGGSMSCWFQLRRPLHQQLTSWSRDYSPDEVAQSVVASFSEVESWLISGVKGPHVHGIDSEA
jgi:hypothetical protein